VKPHVLSSVTRLLKASAAGVCVFAALNSSVMAQSTPKNEADASNYQLLLSGGELEFCSSMRSRNCAEVDWIDRDTMRIDRYMNLSSKYREAVLDRANWPAARNETRAEVKEAIELIHNRVKQDIMPERVFIDEFTRRATKFLYDNLSDHEWNLILDHLEMPVPDNQREVVKLSENLNKPSRAIVETFVKMADVVAQKKDHQLPEIVVITAGSRDPLADVDFYTSLFREAGANVSWLPIDAAVVAARQDNACDELDAYREKELGAWNRSVIHAVKHKTQVEFCKNADADLQILADADGVFLNPGDANLMRNAFVDEVNQPTALLRAIYQGLQNETLVVGGSDEGAVAMTGRPMITNGTSASALSEGAKAAEPPPFGCNRDNSCPMNLNQDSVTYHPLGGLDLFPYAALDTQFSEQGRHGRLLRVVATTGTPVGVGIDQNTALLVNVKTNAFRVFGERGVFFSVGAQQTEQAVASTFHYLLDGSTGTISDRDVTDVNFSEEIRIIQADPTTKFMTSRGANDALRLLCRDRSQMNLVEGPFSMRLQTDDVTKTQRTNAECQLTNGQIGIIYQPQEQL